MDNAKRLLTSTSESWNKWRNENKYTLIRISFLDLDNNLKKLNDYDLSYCIFSHVSFTGLNINQLIMHHSLFNNCDLNYLTLKNSNLESTEFYKCDFENTTITNTSLLYSKFYKCDLFNTVFRKSKLDCSSFSACNLQHTNFKTNNITNSYLSNCMLEHIKFKNIKQFKTLRNWETIFNKTRILPDGDIIGWKQCFGNSIVKLLIPKEAKRSSAFGRKCRCQYAKVLEIKNRYNQNVKETKSLWMDPQVTYKVGKIIKCNKWNNNWLEECSEGIHFFITEYEAKNY